MSSRLSVQKLRRLLVKAQHDLEIGRDFISLRTADLLEILRYLHTIHWTLRDVQILLLHAEHTLKPEKDIQASLLRIEEDLGPVETLFDDVSEAED